MGYQESAHGEQSYAQTKKELIIYHCIIPYDINFIKIRIRNRFHIFRVAKLSNSLRLVTIIYCIAPNFREMLKFAKIFS